MTTERLRPLGAMVLTVLCAVVLGVTSMVSSVVGYGLEQLTARLRLLADEGWIMSGTGVPDPTVGPYISQILANYLQPSSPHFPGQPTFPGYDFQGLLTPEQFCPFVCIPGQPPLNFGQSLNAGVGDLNQAILPQLLAGDNVTVFGYSQSATIASIEMNNLIANAGTAGNPTLDQLGNLHVVLIGDPNNPIGGILDRFQFPDDQHVPFVNIPVSLAPTPTDHISTDIYTGEYDGWANFPQDPTNILAVINALIGIATVHGYYPDYSADQLASAINIGTIGDANFYMIPENLPILQFMYNGGIPGQFFGDLFSPWARLAIDWGYGNAGDPAVNGFHQIPAGDFISGSPYEQAFGVAGGPWAMTPTGELFDGSGVMGLFSKMDPLQMLAGTQNALIQSLVGPWADVAAAASGGTLSAGDISTITGITDFLQMITGYDLVNTVDKFILDGWTSLATSLDLGDVLGPDAVLSGVGIPGDGLLALVGVGFDIFNTFGA
ncbi:PE-PPE domain-containing protein [[Mycobacterium] nativiensis]|uniref:PE-PPE domain-containing protein n=1 Tax=[Mycobacterium] nativiensis TaxID=2855503 RepID=A0ABU5XZ29_9MYCO|nr:PE-PPE domain-containing protein [Mycolicibacter sp. MYC340]MEB3033234.1 PE-PPE domain-containing protein [Mycolicibacter sp. MYC340]